MYDIILPEPSTSFLASCDLWPCHLMWPVMWQHDLCHLTLTLVLKIENRSKMKMKMKIKWKREIKIKFIFNNLDMCGFLKYLRFSWSVQTSNFSVIYNKYCLYFISTFTKANISLLHILWFLSTTCIVFDKNAIGFHFPSYFWDITPSITYPNTFVSTLKFPSLLEKISTG